MKVLTNESKTASKLHNNSNRLRIPCPPKDLISISTAHWNQISQQLQNNLIKRPGHFIRKDEIKNQKAFAGANMTAASSKPFSFLSHLGGKDIFAPTIDSSTVERTYFPRKKSKITIVTDADVDKHEFGIHERRLQRKNKMNLTARGVLEPKQTKLFRPSSSRPNLQTKQELVFKNKENQSRIFINSKDKRRPVSANPKFITISGRNRPLSAQIKMGERKLDNESIDSAEKVSDDINIPEISEVPKFDEVEEEHVQTEEKKFCENVMKSQPTTSTIFKRDKDFDLPYPELFDRTERTIAACYAKFGNLSYFTAVQRIGCYMDFSSRLKRKHLNDIITYMKHNTLPSYNKFFIDYLNFTKRYKNKYTIC